MLKGEVEFGSNPMRFIGFSYSKCMYPLRDKKKPMVTIHLLFLVVWIKLPYSHISSKGYGGAVESWGFVINPFNLYHHINYGYKTKRFFKRSQSF